MRPNALLVSCRREIDRCRLLVLWMPQWTDSGRSWRCYSCRRPTAPSSRHRPIAGAAARRVRCRCCGRYYCWRCLVEHRRYLEHRRAVEVLLLEHQRGEEVSGGATSAARWVRSSRWRPPVRQVTQAPRLLQGPQVPVEAAVWRPVSQWTCHRCRCQPRNTREDWTAASWQCNWYLCRHCHLFYCQTCIESHSGCPSSLYFEEERTLRVAVETVCPTWN